MSINPAPEIKIAIDGPAGAGKSTVARVVARELGLTYLDTGAMYRAITLKIARRGIDLANPSQVEAVLEDTDMKLQVGQKVFLDGEDVTEEIRQPLVNSLVSQVAALSSVRRRLVGMQQDMARRTPGIIMDGRDIATRVMPDADFKFYLDATIAERARRRCKEQLERGLELSIEDVIAEIKERDRIDSQRADSPLTIAPDAVVVDTTGLSFREVVEKLLGMIRGGCHGQQR